MSLLRLRAALLGPARLRGAGVPWSVLRSYSSASAKEKARRTAICERTELLEVLKARVKQLQASSVPEVAVNKVELAALGNDKYQDQLQNVVAPSPARKQRAPKGRGESLAQPDSWVEKLNEEMSVQPLEVEELPIPASQLAQEGQAEAKPTGKAKAKAKAKKSLNIPKAKGAAAWSHSLTGSQGACTHGKPWMAVTKEGAKKEGAKKEGAKKEGAKKEGAKKEGAKEQRPRGVQEDKDSSQYKILQQTIQSSLECFLFLQQPQEAERFLLMYHRSPGKRKLLDVSAYNIVMSSWARKGCLQRIKRLFSLLEAAGLQPSLDSYAALLECMGRNQSSARTIERCLQQLKSSGFHVDELFQKCLFEEDEQEKILRAIRTVQPNYQLPPPPRPQACKSSLLQDFYSREETVSFPKLDFSVQELQERFQQQLEMELDNTVTIESVESTKALTPQAIQARELLASLRLQWHDSLLQALEKSKCGMSKHKMTSGYNVLYPYLCLLPSEEYVGIMLQILSTLSPQGVSLAFLARELGSKVYSRYITLRKLRSHHLEKVQAIYKDYIHLLARDSQPDQYLPREYWEKLVAEAGFGSSLNLKDCNWPFMLLMRLGMHMLELMVQAVKVPRNILNPRLESKLIPALYHIYSFRSSWQQVGLIKPHPIFSQLVADAAETMLTFNSSSIPMLCPPVPWTSPHFGAFVLNDTKLMRFVEGAVQHQQLLDQCPSVNLHPILDALNQLGNCAWKINQPVLDIIISIFNDKGNEKLDIPPPMSEAPRPPAASSNPSTLDKSQKQEFLLCKKKAAEMHSLRMDALYKLSIANYVRDKVFWFPHNMDFRGRTYPCPPYFNHLGNDVTRAILLFAEGRPLGPKGLDWLKIHLINLTGLKKKNSLQERLEYANQLLEEILDSADHPLTGRKWWMNTDEPWQALACCMEIAKALRSPDPAAYVSHFPVHQDGSCNGLQHYAALGRDLIGAMSVNLMPCSVPQDVYSAVAQQVEEFRKKDADQGVKIAQVLQGFVSRKVVKQTVMTVVYGVTRYGGRLQMEKRLKEIEEFPEEYLWEASQYLVKQVFNGIKEMFSATRDIQNWLTESAKLIAQSGRTVEWVTPLGLPIVQPYYRSKSTVLSCSMQHLTVKGANSSQKPDTVKQKNAFPPNFIHSLDSTHMMLTALHCLREGLTFVSVHDCYWTHALTVDVMNQICRQQFVALHNEKILQDLSEFMLEKYCSPGTETRALWQKKLMEQLSNVPKTGEFNLKNVMDSTYFFS